MEDIIYLKMVEMECNHWWYKGRREIIGKLTRSYMTTPLKILDAGCGAGGTMEYLARYGSVQGIDISSQMVEHCRKTGMSAVCASVSELPFGDEEFDMVFCLDVLEHLPDEKTALKELIRVVRPGGVLVFTVPALTKLWGQHDILNNHYRRYNFGDLQKLLTDVNLSIERVTYFNFFLLLPIWLIRKIVRQNNATKTDFQLGTKSLNGFFYLVLKLENLLLGYINLPVGVSQVVIARKKDSLHIGG